MHLSGPVQILPWDFIQTEKDFIQTEILYKRRKRCLFRLCKNTSPELLVPTSHTLIPYGEYGNNVVNTEAEGGISGGREREREGERGGGREGGA